MVTTHALGGGFQGFALLGRDARQRGLQLGVIHHQLIHARDVTTIKTVGVFHQCRIATLGHILEDAAHTIRHFFVALFRPGG